MHDPMTVAHEIRFPKRDRLGDRSVGRRWGWTRRRYSDTDQLMPWWQPRSWRFALAGRAFNLGTTLITIWHVDPSGYDSGATCRMYVRGADFAAIPKWRLRLDPRLKPLTGDYDTEDRDRMVWAADRSWRWHVRHWDVRVIPYQRVKAWLTLRCDECGHRFRWKRDSPHSYMSTDKVWHDKCMALRHTRSQLDDAMTALDVLGANQNMLTAAGMDSTPAWRVGRAVEQHMITSLRVQLDSA